MLDIDGQRELVNLLSENGIRVELVGYDTILITFPDSLPKHLFEEILTAILEADPDEYWPVDGKFRLWWD